MANALAVNAALSTQKRVVLKLTLDVPPGGQQSSASITLAQIVTQAPAGALGIGAAANLSDLVQAGQVAVSREPIETGTIAESRRDAYDLQCVDGAGNGLTGIGRTDGPAVEDCIVLRWVPPELR